MNGTDQSTALRVTISGSYKSSEGHIESFDGIKGIIPCMDEDKVEQMVIKRYAIIWISQARKKDANGKELDEFRFKHVQRMREVFLDDVQVADDLKGKRLSYVGKNIMDLNFEELQDLAAANDLAAVPLYRKGSLTHARRVAFSEYAIKALGYDPEQYDFRLKGYNPGKFPPICADGQIRRQKPGADIEETLDRENLVMQQKAAPVAPDSTKTSQLTIEQLRLVADSKGIKYMPNQGFASLYAKVYGKEAK